MIIGLTGGIGSGKSTVSRILRQLGVPVVDADQVTHDLQRRGQPIWQAIFDHFGWPILTAGGELDRKRLGYRVFSDDQKRQWLNQLIHPVVRQRLRELAAEWQANGTPVVVWDVPLLIEGGLYREVDEVWVVYADPEQQIRRVMERDHVSYEAAQKRLSAQMPLAQKIQWATRVIDNRGSRDLLEKAVTELWQDVRGGR
ncbi:dephospho-CoA kinase [Sulfobacillus acidophilus TPY]|uniref:Dephospho-CoA kinase n=1 Tax=Sulfobacillus acidophilus (strain ATCC 700253 / DSM 10332 / NAL) TaxID=679936 RepID=G8TWR1_SULAD|nr:dephospho-CoA kinase [Sulfobacillus acidophilus TPY]AEW06050.1 dephospho-CoA kinase [Sulfobacillus acidophilus DSM 10332]